MSHDEISVIGKVSIKLFEELIAPLRIEIDNHVSAEYHVKGASHRIHFIKKIQSSEGHHVPYRILHLKVSEVLACAALEIFFENIDIDLFDLGDVIDPLLSLA